MMPKSLDRWREHGEHLPAFMRDFHDQKRVFKWLDRAAQRQNTSNAPYDQHPDFRRAMVYTIDIFLWIMAAHGYTLQKTRQKVADLGDLDTALAQFQREYDELMKHRFDEAMRERRAALTPTPEATQ